MKFKSHADDGLFLNDYEKALDDAFNLPRSIGTTSNINPRKDTIHKIISDARTDVDVSNKVLEKIIEYKNLKETG